MISDDLSSLFKPSAAGLLLPGFFCQGVILSFSSVDGTNTIGANGTTLTNVPMSLTGAEVAYSVGDRVLLIVLGNTYMIHSKIVSPGSAAFASSSQQPVSNRSEITNFATTAGYSVMTTVNIPVPAWANSAACVAVGSVSATAAGGAGVILSYIQIAGATATQPVQQTVLNGVVGAASVGDAQVVSVTPGGTLSASIAVATLTAWTPTATNTCGIRLMAIFRKV